MLASKTSHKRRRSSARGDASRSNVVEPRAIVTIAGSSKEKEREKDNDPSWSWKRLDKIVASHPINHCLQIQIPVTSSAVLEDICKLLPSSKAYAVKVPLCLFLDPIFIVSHIKRGRLIALSKGRLDTDDMFCLDGDGVLHLSLTRDSYQTLGLVGQALKQTRTSSGKGRDRLSGKVERWMVSINLLAPSFVPGRPGFDRTLARLREWDQRRSKGNSEDQSSWDALFCWTDEGSEGGAEMHFPSRHVKPGDKVEINPRPITSSLNDCWTPLHSMKWSRGWKTEGEEGDRLNWDLWYEELETLFEWSGLASMSAESIRTFSRSDHLNSYQVGTTESRQSTSLLQVKYYGLLSSAFCASIIASVRSYLKAKESNRNLDFAIISCSGFADSPLAWKMDPSAPPPSEKESVLQDTSDESENDDDSIARQETGPKARKQRQKKRSKRGTISRHQVGHQVKIAGSSNHNGWQLVLFSDKDHFDADYVLIENVGGCLKC